jgi:hypothetical protein
MIEVVVVFYPDHGSKVSANDCRRISWPRTRIARFTVQRALPIWANHHSYKVSSKTAVLLKRRCKLKLIKDNLMPFAVEFHLKFVAWLTSRCH